MTAVYYPDCSATSPDGRLLLEARSPHNGTIGRRDDGAPAGDEFPIQFRLHQREFRYQLIDTAAGGRVVWERWQPQDEDSPHELLVSDDGWSILRTHGFRPEVIAVTPDGRDALRVLVVHPPQDRNVDEEQALAAAAARRDGISVAWSCDTIDDTTAGSSWSLDAWPAFFRVHDKPFFAWRTALGQRLVIDLAGARVVPDDEHAQPDLARALDEAEQRGAMALLRELTPRLEEIQQVIARAEATDADDEAEQAETELLHRSPVRHVSAAILLAGAHCIRDCVPLLRAWERVDLPTSITGSFAMGEGWYVQSQWYRPYVQHALRLLGEQPAPYPAYTFRTNEDGDADDDDRQTFPAPPRPADLPERVASIGEHHTARDVLAALGVPDFVDTEAHEQPNHLYRWTEDWEYDFRDAGAGGGAWTTLRITWAEAQPAGRIVRIERFPAEWLRTNERLAGLLIR